MTYDDFTEILTLLKWCNTNYEWYGNVHNTWRFYRIQAL